MMIGFMVEKNI
jgi:membrane associated rhomboid family serine protease